MLRTPFGSFGSSWREMERLRREMNQVFSSLSGGTQIATGYPAMNVWSNEDGAVITAELPGMDSEQLDIAVEGNVLTVSGTREREAVPEGTTYHRRERGYGKFTRTFELPFQVQVDKVEATYQNGVLHITLPRQEADKPKRIAIKAA